MKHQLFISYSRKDIEQAKQIKREIEKVCGVECWMDLEGIKSGDQFEDVIVSAIDKSDCLLFLLSENSSKSEYVKKDVKYAGATNKQIIPIKIDDKPLRGWFLFNFGSADVNDYNVKEQKDKVLNNIKEWYGEERKPASPAIFASSGAKPKMHLFILLDCSGSMYGLRMEALNRSMREIFKSLDFDAQDIDIFVNVLKFSSSAEWMYDTPILLEQFIWKECEPEGQTMLNEAYKQLNTAMSDDELFFGKSSRQRHLPSVILLISDGVPSESCSEERELIAQNEHIAKANRFAISIGYDTDINELTYFTSNPKRVFTISDEELSEGLTPLLRRIINMGMYSTSCCAL
ncbi:MAG: TIR domain-containing protein [Alistipes sp.]|nr:TIR domain-containing protein [Alistipes sp.]